jgi:hypothetical protein
MTRESRFGSAAAEEGEASPFPYLEQSSFRTPHGNIRIVLVSEHGGGGSGWVNTDGISISKATTMRRINNEEDYIRDLGSFDASLRGSS